MTLAPTNGSSEVMEVPTFDNEDALYAWMDAEVGDSFQRAKSAVNDWWVRTVTALLTADQHYGWNTASGAAVGRQKKMPERLLDWCNRNGLEEEHKRTKARAMARVWLNTKQDLGELLDSIGTNKLLFVGQGLVEHIAPKLNAALNGASREELQQLNRDLKADPEFLDKKAVEAKKREQELTKKLDEWEGPTNNSNPAYRKLIQDRRLATIQFERFSTTKSEGVVHPENEVDNTALQVANQEALEAKKQALEFKQQIDELKHQIELANKAKEDAEREKRNALRDKKDITERYKSLHDEHTNPVDANLILTGIHMRFVETEKDAKSYEILEPLYQPRWPIENCEKCFVAMVKAWLPIIADERFEEVKALVNSFAQPQPEPQDYIDATVVIN